jgi:transcriptional regulator with XRE-family HTH domain
MVIGNRLRSLREQKKLSQGDIEKRSGLLRCYISRVENGFSTPSVDTLEKMSRALEVPLYLLFYEGDNPPALPKLKRKTPRETSGKDTRLMAKFHRLLSRTDESDRKLLLQMARKMADHKSV